jgi:hypothetical protein
MPIETSGRAKKKNGFFIILKMRLCSVVVVVVVTKIVCFLFPSICFDF